MDLEKLQKKGAVHIGLKTGRKVLYAYVLEGKPSHIAVGWTSGGVTRTPEGPTIPEVVERCPGKVRFLMICHHSSSKELVGKIRDGMTVKGLAAMPPEGAAAEQESWFKAGLENVVYAYPPFAKIFLSEVPSFAEDQQDEVMDERDARNDGKAGLLGFGRKKGEGASDDEEGGGMLEHVLLRSERSRTILSVVLLIGIVIGAAFVALEQLKRTESGRAWLLNAEQFIGFSFGAEEGRGYGFLTRLERQERARGNTKEGAFAEWYDPARTDDAGSTFGMRKDLNGFRIKTWVDGEPGERNLYAAYRFNPGLTTWAPETPEQARTSRRILADLVRAPSMAEALHEDACKALSGRASQISEEEFGGVEVLVVHDTDILIGFRADRKSCAAGHPSAMSLPR